MGMRISNSADFFSFFCEFVLPSAKRQEGRRSSRKAYTCSLCSLFRLSNWISFLQIFMLRCFFSICWWWLKIPWVDREQYQELVNELRWILFFYFRLYSMTSVRMVIGSQHCMQGFVPGCGQSGPRPTFSLQRFQSAGSDIQVVIGRLPKKKKRKKCKKGKLKRLWIMSQELLMITLQLLAQCL